MNKIFPIYRYAHDNGNFVSSPELAKLLWNRIRKEKYPNTIWYAASVIIDSQSSVTLKIYDMKCGVYGGIGSIIIEEKITDFLGNEKELINEHILERCTELAALEYKRRKSDEESEKILAVRKELFGV